MKKNVDKFNSDSGLYLPPKCTCIDLEIEGVLCASTEGFNGSDPTDMSDGWI